ncbi:MAG TPA: hypothetical protein VMM13_07365, partial [Euzebya sp.]|nr:hypothetical protein [Euzebya sp.]
AGAGTMTQATRRTGGWGRTLPIAGFIGPVLYVVLVALLGPRTAGYDAIRDSMSELGAVDAPDHPAGHRAAPGRHRQRRRLSRRRPDRDPVAGVVLLDGNGGTGRGAVVGADLVDDLIGLVQRAGMGLSLVWMMAVSTMIRSLPRHGQLAS